MDKGTRTGAIWGGLILALISRGIILGTDNPIALIIGIALMVFAIGLLLGGCYLWTQLKNRHWAFMLWGLLSPIGLLGISLLGDKTKKPSVDKIK